MVHGFDDIYTSGWLLFSLFHNSHQKSYISFFDGEMKMWFGELTCGEVLRLVISVVITFKPLH